MGTNPDPEALARAPFLEAVCHEILRLYPAIPAVGRKFVNPIQLAGCDLPAGSGVLVNVLWAHYSPQLYPQPERFLPERFLQRSYSPFEFMPFGGGHRRCIGAAFALYEMKLVLATLLQRFAFERPSRKPVRIIQLTAMEPCSPIRMLARPAAN